MYAFAHTKRREKKYIREARNTNRLYRSDCVHVIHYTDELNAYNYE